MPLAPVIYLALGFFCTFVVLWSPKAKNAESKSLNHRDHEGHEGEVRTRENHKGLFCKYFFVLFVSFVVKNIFGCPLHAGGAPVFEDVGNLRIVHNQISFFLVQTV